MTVTDASGRVVYTSQVNGNQALINTQQFANGIYCVSVQSETGVQNGRFAVQH